MNYGLPKPSKQTSKTAPKPSDGSLVARAKAARAKASRPSSSSCLDCLSGFELKWGPFGSFDFFISWRGMGDLPGFYPRVVFEKEFWHQHFPGCCVPSRFTCASSIS